MLRDCLMQRLGLAEERNENFLFQEEYDSWRMRQRIMVCINEEDIAAAEKLLDAYEKNISSHVEQQFCQVMRIQIMRTKVPDCVEVGDLYEKALKLTVPAIDEKNVNELQLSVKELDLVLEYVYHCHRENVAERCEELLEYIDTCVMDEQSRAKILPKVIYYQCRILADKEQADYSALLRRCNQAIECLRDARRLYFFWELLQERSRLYDKLEESLREKNEPEMVGIIRGLQEENAKWSEIIEEVYLAAGMEPVMKNCCYLYLERDTHCINEVIKKRREMLGLTKKQLAEGICSEKTIGRLENTKGKAQLQIVKELFERLGMPGEYQRKEIIAGSAETYEVLEKIVKYGNDRSYDDALAELERLETMLPMEKPLNQQYMKRQRAICLFSKGDITKEEALEEIRGAMNITTSYEMVMRKRVLFLTHSEMTCIQNMALIQGRDVLNMHDEVLVEICKEYERENMIAQNISMYEFVMSAYASALGNMGEYEMSDTISKRIIKECVRCGRFGGIANNLYSLAWNSKEKNDGTFSYQAWVHEVRMAAQLFKIGKKYNSEALLLKALKDA
ncbi:MAG: helix-turn-helix transcriptional regulator [Lachnospiraceae bacterium]|nr:helix-turn-helix transcriptional regulator [Lachnospiraceae bacterium]